MDILKVLWQNRSLIILFVLSEHKSRFSRSKLGWLWVIVQPLAQAAVLALVLSKVIAAKLPGIDGNYTYSVYLLSGMLGWSLFSELIARGTTVFIDNANTIKKIKFPKICLPAIVLFSSLINHVMLLIATVAIFLALGHSISYLIIWLPVYILVTALLGIGIGLLFGTFNVFVRDVGQAMPIMLQFWFWATPIVYHQDIVPKALAKLLKVNPATHLIRGYQDVLVYQAAPNLPALAVIVSGSLIFLAIVLKLFRRASAEMVDEF